MNLSALVRDIPGIRPFAGGRDVEITSIVLDSRRVTPGALFVAVQGDAADGHAHIADARARGAVAVAIERPTDLAAGLPTVRIRDGRRVAGWLAARLHGEPSHTLRLVGITGTNGKTTTSGMLRAICDTAGLPAGLSGTICTDTGVARVDAALTTPDAATLQALFAEMRDAGRRVAAMEVSSHALEQGRTAGTRFAVGVLTNVTRDHLDYHRTPARYRAAKGLLFSGLESGAHAVLNDTDPATIAYAAGTRARVWRYGAAPHCDIRLTRVAPGADGVGLSLDTPAGSVDTILRLRGRVNAWNAAAATGAALALGIAPDAIAAGLAALPGVPGRLEFAGRADGVTVLVDYAHTPDALDAALTSARELAGNATLRCVFGCGGDRDRGKRAPMAAAVARHADVAYLTSDNPRTEDPEQILDDAAAGFAADAPVWREIDRATAIHRAVAEARPGDWIIVAGKGHETYQIVGTERRAFDDRAVARAALAARSAGLAAAAA